MKMISTCNGKEKCLERERRLVIKSVQVPDFIEELFDNGRVTEVEDFESFASDDGDQTAQV